MKIITLRSSLLIILLLFSSSITTFANYQLDFDCDLTDVQITTKNLANNQVMCSAYTPCSCGDIIPGTQVQISFLLPDGYTFQHWIRNGDQILNLSTLEFSVNQNHSLELVLMDYSNIKEDIKENDFNFSFYPNPASSFTTFEFNIQNKTNAVIDIYSMRGELLVSIGRNYYTPGNYKIHYDVSNLATGIYCAILRTRNLRTINKIFVKI